MRALFAGLLLLALTACGPIRTPADDDDDDEPYDPSGLPQGTEAPRAPMMVTIQYLFDGDTAEIIDANGFSDSVRFLNIDTPETGECWSSQATAAAEELLPEGSTAWITFDGEQRDGFGRLLCHLFPGERPTADDWVNLFMVQQGHAQEFVFDANDTYRAEFEQAEQEAMDAGLGQWSACN
ncbi:MAG: thermonuclease family protein [Proteobacteria bacterium]|nr:thermonuclease family protein [Pseudomonadota bacterium]